jgi:hypothetical protein
MPRKPKLFDYSQLSDFREYAPLNSDPTDFDVSRVTEKNRRDCTTPLDLISGVDETDWGYPAAIVVCNNCGWWCRYSVGSNRDGFFEWERVPASLRRYDISDIALR